MQEKARVIEIKGNKVALVPVDLDACAGCSNTMCKEGGHVFYAKNTKGLPVQKGSIVRVAAPVYVQAYEVVIGLLVPLFAAVLVFLISSSFWKGLGEQGVVGISLGVLGLMFFLSYQLGLRNSEKRLPVIIDIL